MMFVGREYELELLNDAFNSNRPELVILYGRRRVGKSTLLKMSAGAKKMLSFEALEGMSTVDQIKHFLRQLAEQTNNPIVAATNWHGAFSALTQHVIRKRCFLVFDELPWMATGRSQLVSLIKYFWDNKWKNNEKLTLVLCGSVASFMIKHVVHSKALHNRKTLEIALPPLPAHEARHFFQEYRSNHEVAEFLMIFGGIPKYLEQVDPKKSLADNLDRLCFSRHAFFLQEFDTIFKEQFSWGQVYSEIVKELVKGTTTRQQLAEKLDFKNSGGLNRYLTTLEQAEFIKQFSLKDVMGRGSKTKRIVLWDEFIRFYLTWIEPNRLIIGNTTKPGLSDRLTRNGIDTYFGLAFERLCMKNIMRIFESIGIEDYQILGFGPFFRQRSRKDPDEWGLQIDVLVRRRGDVLTLIECKFSKNPIGTSVINEVKEKIAFLRAPKRCSIERVLLSAGDVSSNVINSGFFNHIVGLEALF